MDIKKGSSCSLWVRVRQNPWLDQVNRLLPNTIVIQSTYVYEKLRGQNIARQLVQHVADMARKEQKKIVPFCSYVIALFNKTDEFDDVAAKG